MNDLQIANEIIVSAVRDSSYVTVLISSCVFIIYTIIIKVVDVVKSKNRHKPLIQMADAVKEIGENVVKLNLVLSKTIQESETKEFNRINQIINTCFNSFRATLMSRCFDIIIHNALIDHGSSGGPLLNASGKLVGLNFAGFESNHHGCAVPMSKINEFLNTYVYNK